MELSRGLDTGISALENELTCNYYMWANRRERRHANWAAMPNAGTMPTILRWYGANIERSAGCSVCGERMTLDLGEEDAALLARITALQSEKRMNIDFKPVHRELAPGNYRRTPSRPRMPIRHHRTGCAHRGQRQADRDMVPFLLGQMGIDRCSSAPHSPT